jgi:hypothetical protein
LLVREVQHDRVLERDPLHVTDRVLPVPTRKTHGSPCLDLVNDEHAR